MSITALPTPPNRTQDSVTFSNNADAFMTALPTFATEVDATAVSMTAQVGVVTSQVATVSAIASGVAYSIPYIFDSATADSDPTSGKLRLGSATQNTSTVIRAENIGADGATWSSVLADFSSSTNPILGQIRLVKLGDATKWLTFNVTAVSPQTNYKNITVVPVASSSASPFTAGDSMVLAFTRTGDKGDVGATGASTLYLKVSDQKASGTAGGSSLAGDITQTRVLNTVSVNTISGASLATNTVTLPAGTYDCFARTPGQSVNASKAFLYNVSDTTYTLIGSSIYCGNPVQGDSIITGRFTISSTKNFTIRHWTSAAAVTTGLGTAVSTGQVEVYAEAIFWKVA